MTETKNNEASSGQKPGQSIEVIKPILEILAGGKTAEHEVSWEEAQGILEHMNKRNRPVSQSQVEKLVGAMERGEWKFNGDTIRFYKDGSLCDGQHRLHASWKAHAPLRTLIVPNIEDDAIHTIDQVAKGRTSKESLEMAKVERADTVDRIAKSSFAWMFNGEPNGLAPSNRQLLDYVTQNQDLFVECAKFADDLLDRKEKVLNVADVGCLRFCGIKHGEAAETLDEWVTSVVTGVAAEGNPEAPNLKLHQMLQRAKTAERKRDKVPRKARLAFLLEGYQYFKAKQVGPFRYGKGRNTTFPSWTAEEVKA
jgi:hypothetical protein